MKIQFDVNVTEKIEKTLLVGKKSMRMSINMKRMGFIFMAYKWKKNQTGKNFKTM